MLQIELALISNWLRWIWRRWRKKRPD